MNTEKTDAEAIDFAERRLNTATNPKHRYALIQRHFTEDRNRINVANLNYVNETTRLWNETRDPLMEDAKPTEIPYGTFIEIIDLRARERKREEIKRGWNPTPYEATHTPRRWAYIDALGEHLSRVITAERDIARENDGRRQ